jgi:hypothetical protein
MIAKNTFEEQRQERLSRSSALYMYQPLDTNDDRRLDWLRSDQLWMSDTSNFNDPLDVRLKVEDLRYRGPFDDDFRIRSAMKSLVNENPAVLNHWFYDEVLMQHLQHWIDHNLTLASTNLCQQIERRFREFGVACFTPDWNNELMWAHYASSHRGFCVEYSIQKMNVALRNQGTFSCFDVQYVSSLPDLCISEALFSPHQTLGRMLATKHLNWAYEKEWRLVHLEKKSCLVDLPDGVEISALIAGVKASPEFIMTLKEKAKSFNVPSFQIRKSDFSYELKLVPID